jgi:hypothetical protein
MPWEVLLHDDFAAWLASLDRDIRVRIVQHFQLLSEFGPTLGRPRVDTVKGSEYPNMKELRVQVGGDPWRVLFAFDPLRRAVLLVGGNKGGNDRWYDENIRIADDRFKGHLDRLKAQGLSP